VSASGRPIPSGPKADTEKRRGSATHRGGRQHAHGGSVDEGRQNGATIASAPDKDPHTLEREARDRERLLKEMQRRATQEGGRGKGNDARRRSSGKHEDELGNVRRGERDRDRQRWR
jgi:hypothetical protein